MIRWLILLFILLPQGVFAQAAPEELLNSFRADHDRAAVSRVDALDRTAMGHAQDIRDMGRLSHQGTDGSSVMDRIAQQGVRPCFAAENIAMGQGDVVETFEDWADSRGHRRNMLDRRATQFGFAVLEDIRVLVLAAPC